MPYPLDYAAKAAWNFAHIITPYCSKVDVAGSIRRGKLSVNDADIVAIPDDPLSLTMRLGPIPRQVKSDGKTMDGPKLKRLIYKDADGRELPIDLYLTTPGNWGCMMLIRTGSTAHNIFMVTEAKKRGWKLHASGEGLYNARVGGQRIDDGTEQGIFEALGIPYKEPSEREVP